MSARYPIFLTTMASLCIVLLGVAGLVVSRQVRAAVTSNTVVDVSGPVFDACTGETILLSGSVHMLTSTTIDENGGMHLHTQFNLAGVGGETEAGVKYHVQNTFTRTDILLPSGAGNGGTIQSVRFVSQGNEPDLVLRLLLHITVNANGELTGGVFEFKDECS
jgi:hypothetical protein